MAHIFASDRSSAPAPRTTNTQEARDTAPEQSLAELQMRADQSGATGRLTQLQSKGNTALQLQEDEELQMKPVQRMEEDEALQGKSIQRMDDEEALQGKAAGETLQAKEGPGAAADSGMPAGLRNGVEQLSGVSMENVQVHRNSAEPAKVGAHAYAQGQDIHLASGQDQHLPHEAWHVAQQAQGRVRPTMQASGVAINDDPSLEKEADVMGAKASQLAAKETDL